jgi:hypothetical protein
VRARPLHLQNASCRRGPARATRSERPARTPGMAGEAYAATNTESDRCKGSRSRARHNSPVHGTQSRPAGDGVEAPE